MECPSPTLSLMYQYKRFVNLLISSLSCHRRLHQHLLALYMWLTLTFYSNAIVKFLIGHWKSLNIVTFIIRQSERKYLFCTVTYFHQTQSYDDQWGYSWEITTGSGQLGSSCNSLDELRKCHDTWTGEGWKQRQGERKCIRYSFMQSCSSQESSWAQDGLVHINRQLE